MDHFNLLLERNGDTLDDTNSLLPSLLFKENTLLTMFFFGL